jgi:hypothetical protein
VPGEALGPNHPVVSFNHRVSEVRGPELREGLVAAVARVSPVVVGKQMVVSIEDKSASA